ncbi:MAG: glycosyltransferase family 4 protein [Timaviella obliquedivisa GSE-PSE-MK23-08B]|jgi:glycosyltransferase involved in cell wall biosynthesis|nr:glycosyltransferase family 4 protein [Timaviella obliquedivisa GSE-PSE-MK23-08B]
MALAPDPLKVLHICQRDDIATGGAARVAVEYVKRLPAHEVDAHCLFLYGEPGPFQTELSDSLQGKSTQRAHYLGLQDSRDVLKMGRLRAFIQQFQPHILHHHDGLLWSHLLTFIHPGILKVVHAHLGANRPGSQMSRSSLASWVQQKSTDLLICITEDTCKSQIEWGGYNSEKTCVLYNGVDSDRFYPASVEDRLYSRQQFSLPNNVFVVGFVGRLHSAMKGTDDFLRVISLLPTNFWGLVVGDGPDAASLRELATALGVENRVIFTGVLEQTTSAYHAIDSFCLTSHWEPFGLVVAEAMACQVPVIGFACEGGVREILNPDTGYVLPKRDLRAMAATIHEAVYSSEQQRIHRFNAQSLLERHHQWMHNSEKLARLYQKLMAHTQT